MLCDNKWRCCDLLQAHSISIAHSANGGMMKKASRWLDRGLSKLIGIPNEPSERPAAAPAPPVHHRRTNSLGEATMVSSEDRSGSSVRLCLIQAWEWKDELVSTSFSKKTLRPYRVSKVGNAVPAMICWECIVFCDQCKKSERDDCPIMKIRSRSDVLVQNSQTFARSSSSAFHGRVPAMHEQGQTHTGTQADQQLLSTPLTDKASIEGSRAASGEAASTSVAGLSVKNLMSRVGSISNFLSGPPAKVTTKTEDSYACPWLLCKSRPGKLRIDLKGCQRLSSKWILHCIVVLLYWAQLQCPSLTLLLMPAYGPFSLIQSSELLGLATSSGCTWA